MVAAPATPRGNRASKEYWTVRALRFVAALAVICVHSTFYTHERLAPGLPVYDQGAHGVRLFFVISGFVMILSSERLATQARGWLTFAIKRILRIVPLYWLMLLLKIAMLLGTRNLALHTKLDPIFALKSFLFIPALDLDGKIMPLHGVGWTLNFEMFFYLLFTIALLLRMPPVRFIAPVLVLCAALSLLVTPDWPVALQFYCNPVVVDFLAGMMIARWCQRGLVLPAGIAWALVAIGLLGLFLPILPDTHSLGPSLLITAFSAATIVGAGALEPRIGTRLPSWAVFMGAASYSLYLIHPLIAPISPTVFARLHLHWAIPAVLGSIAVALVSGALLYVFVETPMSRFFNRRLKGTRLMGPAPHIGGPRPEENVPGVADPAAHPAAGATLS